MPLWAVGLTVAFARESLDLSAPRQRLLFRVGVGTVGLFVVVNEAERRLLGDIETYLGRVVADDDGYAHDELDGNADSHLRSLLLDESVSVPVRDGDLALGRWQSILLVECDGPRTRSVTVTCTS